MWALVWTVIIEYYFVCFLTQHSDHCTILFLVSRPQEMCRAVSTPVTAEHYQHHNTMLHLLCSYRPTDHVLATEVTTHHHSTLTKHVPWSPGHGHVLSCSSGGGCLLRSSVEGVTGDSSVGVWWWPGHWQPDTGDPATTDTTATTAATHTGR